MRAALALLIAAMPIAAQATDDENAPPPRNEKRIATVHVVPHSGYPDTWGLSLAVHPARGLQAEAGFSLYSLKPESGGSYFVRAGIVHPIEATSPLEIQLLAGYRRQIGVEIPFTEHCDECERELATFDIGVEKRWLGPRLWVTGQAMVGVGAAYNDIGTSSGNVYPEVRASLGVAF